MSGLVSGHAFGVACVLVGAKHVRGRRPPLQFESRTLLSLLAGLAQRRRRRGRRGWE
jgi:hypothetical protein